MILRLASASSLGEWAALHASHAEAAYQVDIILSFVPKALASVYRAGICLGCFRFLDTSCL